ncbi:RecX family transcriptional regulator [Lacticaseibacillus thailandensis]|uniref:RecX family transcriptional regulator n=1 Tax=Lacticaseibacillus thailandensis TaxID=381741 RepID=UPI0006D20F8A|nr:RecX family transcriptional regulator [Lacticaseibacillus thailandensis]
MAVITAVTPQKRRGYYNIFVDGHFALGVSEDTLVRFRLVKGAELDADQMAHVQSENALSRAMAVAFTYLNHQARTAREVHDRLADEDIPEDAIATVLTRLQDRGYIDDAKYAQYFADDNVTMGDRGPRQLAHRLRQKGISAAVVERVVADYTPEQRLAVGTV